MSADQQQLTFHEAGHVEPMRFNSLDEWLAWQEALHYPSIELGLDRCMQVAGRMGLLQPNYTVISVAGTNGKGSTVNFLSSIYKHAGYITGSYTSPHLIRYNERICINGREISDEMLCTAFNRVDRARGDISLTYFEFGTLAAMDIFQRSGVEIAILEVGLGGRLDAVNCLDADVALITTIDLDHENWLGSDRESIGREKAGIMRSGSPVICSEFDPPQSVIDYANALSSRLSVLGKDYEYHAHDYTWSWQSGSIRYENLPRPALYNPQQMTNAAGVLMALTILSDRFPVDIQAIKHGLQDFNLAGRFQIVPDKAQLILDVAHNRQAAALLVQNLKALPIKGKTHVLIGMLKDKNHLAVFRELSAVTDFWHIVTLDTARGAENKMLAEKLSGLYLNQDIVCYNTVADAMEYIRDKVETQDRIVVTGSFLTVGAAIEYLKLQH